MIKRGNPRIMHTKYHRLVRSAVIVLENKAIIRNDPSSCPLSPNYCRIIKIVMGLLFKGQRHGHA